jgi:hypothetical protein
MRSPKQVREEYKYVCKKMADLMKKGSDGPLPQDSDLYCRLGTVKNTLEWVHPLLIRTKAKGADRLNELISHRHYFLGPTFAELHP